MPFISTYGVACETDKSSTFQRVFAGTGGDTTGGAQVAWDVSILDSVMEDYRHYASRVGPEDKAKLEAHLEMIREAQQGLKATVKDTCMPPTGVNPMPGFYEDGANDSINRYQHDRGFQPGSLEVIYNWYASNFQYLLQKMDAVKEGNGLSLLDNSVVLWVTEIQDPPSHGQRNMPFVLAGKAGGALPSGRWLKVASQPHNNLLVSLLNLFGLPNTRFGHPDFCTGSLAGLV